MSKKAALAAELEAQIKPIIAKEAKEAKQQRKQDKAARIDFKTTLGNFGDDEEFTDSFTTPPQPTPEMFYGFVGEIAYIAANGTEVNPVAVAIVVLSFLGAYVGRDTFLHINNTIHHPRLFTLHIGRSGTGKGDAQQLIWRVMRRINEMDSGLLGGCHSGGLSTREGLIMLMHDGIGETPAILDKRLWIVESEFANVLHQSKREGNTLSSCLREMWDGNSSSPATKSSRIACTAPHVGIHANITPSELNAMLSSKEMSNGFANRFLMVWAENIGNVPFPKTTPQSVIDTLATKVMEIIRFAKGGYPNTQDSHEMMLSAGAEAYYCSIYPTLNAPVGNDFLTGMLNRRKPYVLRLAMLFALTDQTRVIEAKHLMAAYAWVNYGIDTVRFVFADKASSPDQAETRHNADKILAYLELRPDGASLNDLGVDCFSKNLPSSKLNKALSFLLCETPLRIEKMEGKKATKGRTPTVFKLKALTGKTGLTGYYGWRGFEGIKQAENDYGIIRVNSNNDDEKSLNPYLPVTDKTTSNPDVARYPVKPVKPVQPLSSTGGKNDPENEPNPKKPAPDLVEIDLIDPMEGRT